MTHTHPAESKHRARGCPCPPGQWGKRPRGRSGKREAAGAAPGRASPAPAAAQRTGAMAEPLSPSTLGVSFIPGPAALSSFSETQTAVANEIRSPQITELCRTL